MSPRANALPPEERRRAIIEVVVPLLLERGHEVTTREIAEAGGIAEGTIFRVFPDKAALWTAVAEHTLDPVVELAGLRAALEGRTELRAKIIGVAEHLVARSQRVMAVMIMMRSITMSCPPGQRHGHEPGHEHEHRRPPAFMVEANRALMSGLTELFAGHREELAVDPAVAATVLRALALGQRHLGAVADPPLSPDLIADVMLDGIRRTPEGS